MKIVKLFISNKYIVRYHTMNQYIRYKFTNIIYINEIFSLIVL